MRLVKCSTIVTCCFVVLSTASVDGQRLVNGTNSSTPSPDPPITSGPVLPTNPPLSPTDAPVTPPASPSTEPPAPPQTPPPSLPPPSSPVVPVTEPPVAPPSPSETPPPSPPPPSSSPVVPVTEPPVAPPSPSESTPSPSPSTSPRPASSTSQPDTPTPPSSEDQPTEVPSEEPPTSPPPASSSNSIPIVTPSSVRASPTSGSTPNEGLSTGGSIGIKTVPATPVLTLTPLGPRENGKFDTAPPTSVQLSPASPSTAPESIVTFSASPSSNSSLFTTLGSVLAAVVVCGMVAFVFVQRRRRRQHGLASIDEDDMRMAPQGVFVPHATSRSGSTSLRFHEQSTLSSRSHLPDSPTADLSELSTMQNHTAFDAFMLSLQRKSPLASQRSAWHAAADDFDEAGSYGSHASNSSELGYRSSLDSTSSTGSKSLHNFDL